MSQANIPLFPATPASQGSGFTGRDLWRQWFKYWGTVVGATVTVGLLTLYGVTVQPSTYTATAKVWVKTEQQGSPTFLSGVAAYREGQMPDPVNRKIETEMQLLMSRPNVEAVIKKLDIQAEHFAGSPLSYLLGPIGKKPKSPEQRLNDTIAAFLKAIKVEAARSKTAETSSNLLEIKLETTDSELTARALNALVEQYQKYGAALTRQQGQATYTLIAEKMKLEMQLAEISEKASHMATILFAWEYGGNLGHMASVDEARHIRYCSRLDYIGRRAQRFTKK